MTVPARDPAPSSARGAARRGVAHAQRALALVVVLSLAAFAQQAYVRDEAAWKAANAEAASSTLLLRLAPAQQEYREAKKVFASSLEKLKSAGVLGGAVAKGKKYGYVFKVLRADANGFAIRAAPEQQGKTGDRIFLLTENGQFHTDDGSEPKEKPPEGPPLIRLTPPWRPKVEVEKGTKLANEVEAYDALFAIHMGQDWYRSQDLDGNGAKDYAPTLEALAKANKDFQYRTPQRHIATGSYSGYKFKVLRGDRWEWCAIAVPEKPGETGDRAFFIDETSLRRFTPDGKEPKQSSEPIATFQQEVDRRP